jgi:hypothetical protein
MSDGQDWTKVQIGSGTRAHGGAGAGAGRPHVAASVVAAAKLDAADGAAKPKYLSFESVREIQAFRREHSLTQAQLDGRCHFPAGRMNALESRSKVPPNSKEIQTLNNLLRTRLVLE